MIALEKLSAPSTPSDFRPTTLLRFLSKVLEKIAHDQITEYLMGAGLLDPLQTGFRRFNSTDTALLKLTEDIRIGIHEKMVTFLLLFDFSKVFDTIPPSRLIRKLQDMGFSRTPLMWIKTYMIGRSQRVVFISGEPEYLETNLGVPQGSVLGPLLFSIWGNLSYF